MAFIFSELVTELAQSGLSGQSKQITASAFIVAQRTLVLAVVLGSLLFNVKPWIPATVAFLISSIIAVASCRSLLTWGGVHVLQLLSTSRGYWASSLTSSLTQLDVPTARVFGGDTASGILAAGSRLGTPLNLVTNAMLNVFVPTLVKSDSIERDRLFRRMRTYAVWYAAALAASSPLVVWALIQILGSDYAYGWPVYIAICLGAAMSGVSQTYQSLVYTEGRPARAALFVATGTAISLASMAIGVHLIGVEGLALGPVVGQAAILLMFHLDWMRRP
ncbi:lipopolysaccharide biosynthesis protein [Microbacterium laevaniformans]|uniref:lipopolysaccharide biosynthesis protein n=1 Tax=Microbacterium laevaniformans TaxID=36807 RepID=UPI003645E7E4